MSGDLCLRNRQHTRPVDLRRLTQITRHLLVEHFPHGLCELGVHLVAAPEMTRHNERFLGHAGSTDVITFDYADTPGAPSLCGEIFLCVDDAVAQARLFRTTWQSELVRYLIHGLLHLHGHDDLQPAARRRMKRQENRILREVSRRFAVARLARRGQRPKTPPRN
jgi:probable rRNA maturation factor